MQIGSSFPTASGFSGRIFTLTVELLCPALLAPVRANLIPSQRGGDEHVLLWSQRPRGANAE